MMNEQNPEHKQQVNTHEINADSTDTGGNTNVQFCLALEVALCKVSNSFASVEIH